MKDQESSEHPNYLLPIEKVNLAADEMDTTGTNVKKSLKTMKLPVAYYNPNKKYDDLKTMQQCIVPSSTIGREHDIRMARKEAAVIESAMLQPMNRMQVNESTIPLHTIYNGLIDDAKASHARRNLHLKSVYKPEEPPQSIQICYMKDFLKWDTVNGKFVDDKKPAVGFREHQQNHSKDRSSLDRTKNDSRTLRKFTLANLKMFK